MSEEPNHFPGRRHDSGSFLYLQISVGNSKPGSAVSSIQCLDGSKIIVPASGGALVYTSFQFFAVRTRRFAQISAPQGSLSRVSKDQEFAKFFQIR